MWPPAPSSCHLNLPARHSSPPRFSREGGNPSPSPVAAGFKPALPSQSLGHTHPPYIHQPHPPPSFPIPRRGVPCGRPLPPHVISPPTRPPTPPRPPSPVGASLVDARSLLMSSQPPSTSFLPSSFFPRRRESIPLPRSGGFQTRPSLTILRPYPSPAHPPSTPTSVIPASEPESIPPLPPFPPSPSPT